MGRIMIGFKSGFTMLLDAVDGKQLVSEIVKGMRINLNAPIQICVADDVFINTSDISFIIPESIAHNTPLHADKQGRLSEVNDVD
jgi:hypothetical protein